MGVYTQIPGIYVYDGEGSYGQHLAGSRWRHPLVMDINKSMEAFGHRRSLVPVRRLRTQETSEIGGDENTDPRDYDHSMMFDDSLPGGTGNKVRAVAQIPGDSRKNQYNPGDLGNAAYSLFSINLDIFTD